MSNEDTQNSATPETPATDKGAGTAPPASEKTEAEIHALIEALNAENANLKDKALRTLADMENLRRRTEKEIADSRLYAVTNFARDILSVADNVRRGLESVPADVAAAADGPFKALIEGIELTERDLLKTLERHGVKKLEPKGERFDPNRHQAMFEIPDESLPHGTVTQVVQAGYVIGDRPLRPALVGVSKGGPKPTGAAGLDVSA